MENKAIFMSGTNNMIWKDIPMPQLSLDDVLIKVEAVGICGSDMHYYQHGKIGSFIVQGDLILGHEASGTVIKVGENVKNLKEGDRVAMEPGVTCGYCEFCVTGKYNLCPDVEFFATPPYDGVFANYVKHPASKCFVLPDNVNFIEGALVEPLNVGLHAANQGNVKLGDSVVIFGTGCIGLCSILASKAMGASKIIVVDILQNRLEKALEIGATHVINAKNEDAIKKIMEITNNKGAEVVIETAGTEITFAQTVDAVKISGTIVLVGMTPKDSIEFNFMKLQGKEAQITTVFRYRNLYPTAINAISSGSININSIVSHKFPFEETKNAFDYVSQNPGDVVKAVIVMQ